VDDHARFALAGEDEGGPAQHVVLPDRPGELVLVVDPVLQRQHRRALAQQRLQTGRGCLGVECLDTKQHIVAGVDLGRVVGGRDLDREVALDALDPQAVLAERLEVGAAVDEVDVAAGLGEPAPEIASDPAGAVDGDPHAHPPGGR
jgi:hypothetical protein